MVLTGAGQIGTAIARRMGHGMKIVVGDKKQEKALAICTVMNKAGFDAVPVETDISSRQSIMNLISEAQKYGDFLLVNVAGVFPSQASIETILNVDLYGTAVLAELFPVEWLGRRAHGGRPRLIRCGSFWRRTCPAPGGRGHGYTGHARYTENDPPTFALVNLDDLASPRVMERKITALNAAGVNIEFHLYRDAGHGFGVGTGTDAEGWMKLAIRFWENTIQAKFSKNTYFISCNHFSKLNNKSTS